MLSRLKFLPLVIVVMFFTSVAFFQLAAAETPPQEIPVGSSIAQENGVTLEKTASADTIALGQVVTYTVSIRNEGAETINPTMTDPLPEGLSVRIETIAGLQSPAITATMGTFEYDVEDTTVSWSGQLAQGEEARIIYQTIPPTTSSAGQTLANAATLEFGGTTLEAVASITTDPADLGIWGRFVNFIASALVFLDGQLANFSIPYDFGFAIILFTVIVRLATFPLNLQQIRSSKGMQELQPRMKELQEKYKNDREKLAQEQWKLYQEHGVNPLGGCLPMLVQMPIWFALYQALLQLSREGLITEGFFWIPSLSGPVTDYSGGMSWIWPLPPAVGWESAIAYLIMPVLLVVSQFYTQQMMMPPSTDPQQQSMQSIMKFMPLMFGYFALIVPSGLTLYWFTSNILAVAQHYATRTEREKNALNLEKDEMSSSDDPPLKPVTANGSGANSTSADSGGSKKDTNDSRSRRKKSKRKR